MAVFFLIGITFSFRVTQGIDEAQRAVVKAYDVGAKGKAPYLYSKTRGYKEVASILASEADDVGSKIFAIRTMDHASKAISASFSGKEELTPIESLPMVITDVEYDDYFVEDEESKKEKPVNKFSVSGIDIDVGFLKQKIEFIRSNRGLYCSPKELGRAEAFYDALVYELKKGRAQLSPCSEVLQRGEHREQGCGEQAQGSNGERA
ncbi:MAG: hypothetical protein Q9N34_07500 [Aquificota bacterium]|nr:hypothetical protein [Aquificota bacterium]